MSNRIEAPTKSIKTDEIKATIICVTYNHEKYIGQCLQSLVSQKTNFRFKVFVGEDKSQDKTIEIIKNFAEKYPNIIVPFYREKNLGSTENFCSLCELVDTPYIAFCDGDDYWTDDYRLQKQYDLLQKNPKANIVFCSAELLIEGKWAQKSFYSKRNKKIVWPKCNNEFARNKKVFNAKTLLKSLPAQSVNTMVRRNEKLKPLPGWMRQIYICDAPFILLHLGKGDAIFMPEIMCVYRRQQSSIFYSENLDEHFIKTRPQYIKYLSGLKAFYKKYYNGWAEGQFDNRIKLETNNYFSSLNKINKQSLIADFIRNNPEISKCLMESYISFFRDQNRTANKFSWDGYKILTRDRFFQTIISPLVFAYKTLKVISKKMQAFLTKTYRFFRKKAKGLYSLSTYWFGALIPKKKNLWVFTSFKQKGYLDNSKYLFEYVVQNHPEIKAVWLTKDVSLQKRLTSEGKICYISRSYKAKSTMLRAKIAFTDHFRVTDFPAYFGFNAKTKVVQLWHGVGFKSMGDGKQVKNTDIPGVVYSDDFLIRKEDSFLVKIKKSFLRFRYAYNRELFEEYFAFVCPGQERIDMIGKIWNIPPERYIMAGHPRNYPVYCQKDSTVHSNNINIIYAPTYRIKKDLELKMIYNIVSLFPNIQKLMIEIGGVFTIRLHPHTWRDYDGLFKKNVSNFNRIKFDKTSDIYETISKYDLMISDYSSVSLDFVLFGKPVIYYIPDYEDFCLNDSGFNLDFISMTPGPKVFDWNNLYDQIKKFIMKPNRNRTLRNKVLRYYFDFSVNNIENSKIIVSNVKKRLGIE